MDEPLTPSERELVKKAAQELIGVISKTLKEIKEKGTRQMDEFEPRNDFEREVFEKVSQMIAARGLDARAAFYHVPTDGHTEFTVFFGCENPGDFRYVGREDSMHLAQYDHTSRDVPEDLRGVPFNADAILRWFAQVLPTCPEELPLVNADPEDQFKSFVTSLGNMMMRMQDEQEGE